MASTNGLVSPDVEDTFSTPPTSPRPEIVVDAYESPFRPSLSRKGSRLSTGRPLSLNLDPSWQSDIVLEQTSPPGIKKNGLNGIPNTTNILTPTSSAPVAQHRPQLNGHQPPMHSPCFVHSHLDKGASLTDWLRNKQNAFLGDVGVAPSLQRTNGNGSTNGYTPSSSSPRSGSSSAMASNDEDDEYGGSLTRQLAETAVGVREMSKQLGSSLYIFTRTMLIFMCRSCSR